MEQSLAMFTIGKSIGVSKSSTASLTVGPIASQCEIPRLGSLKATLVNNTIVQIKCSGKSNELDKITEGVFVRLNKVEAGQHIEVWVRIGQRAW